MIWTCLLPREDWIPARGGSDRRGQGKFARSGAPLVEVGHRLAPAVGGHGALGGGHFELHQLLGLGEGRRGYFRSDSGACSKSGRRTRRQVCWILNRGILSGWILPHAAQRGR